MFQAFGSPECFVQEWRRATDEALASGRYCSGLRSLNSVFKLLIASEELRRAADEAEANGIAHMTPAEAKEARLQAVMDIIKERPEVAVVAADRLGWRVEPPEENVA